MTNYEHYKDDDEFNKICMCDSVAVDRNTNCVVLCTATQCENCLFNGESDYCCKARLEWLNSEYIEPKVEEKIDWSKVEVDACVLVKDRDDDEWNKRHFAEYKKCETDGKYKVHTYSSGFSSWTCNNKNTVAWEMAQLIEIENK